MNYEYCYDLSDVWVVYQHKVTHQFDVFDRHGQYQYTLMHGVSWFGNPCRVNGHGWI